MLRSTSARSPSFSMPTIALTLAIAYCAMTTTNFLAALGPSGTTHQASNVAAPPPGFTGAQLDSNHLQEEMYMHASRALVVGRFKPDISTHDNAMQRLSSLFGNNTIINTANGEMSSRSLASSAKNHRASNNRLRPEDQSSPNKKDKKKSRTSRKEWRASSSCPATETCP
jgi:hypothetical protein